MKRPKVDEENDEEKYSAKIDRVGRSIKMLKEEIAGKVTVPESVISSCQIDKYGTGLLFSLKRILDVLNQRNNLMYG